MSSYKNAARAADLNTPFIHAFLAEEQELRRQRAHDLGPSNAKHLRLVADDIEAEGIIELPGVDAERLRLLAQQLDEDEDEIAALRAHANTLHRALCDAIDDLDTRAYSPPVVFVVISADAPFAPFGVTPAQFSDLAVFLLDEAE